MNIRIKLLISILFVGIATVITLGVLETDLKITESISGFLLL